MEESADTYEQAADVLDTAGEQAAAGASLTYGGLAQAELMFCRFDRAEHWARRALSTADRHDVASRSAALRVLGVVEVLDGDLDAGLEHSRAAVDASLAPAPLGARQRHAGHDPLRDGAHRGRTERRPGWRHHLPAGRVRDELRNVPRRRRRPLPGAPGPLGRSGPRPGRRVVARVDPDRRHPARRRRGTARRSSRTARDRGRPRRTPSSPSR